MTLSAVQNPELYDQIELGNVESPGKVTLSGHDSEVEWDIKAGAGQNGATMTRKGRKPKEFTATFYLVKDDVEGYDDFEFWDEFQALIDSTTSGKTPKALDIWHPDLERVGIKSVVKKSVGGMVHDGKGGATVVVKFIEYLPPKPAGGSPNGALRAKPKADDPNAAALAELARLTEQYKATPWG